MSGARRIRHDAPAGMFERLLEAMDSAGPVIVEPRRVRNGEHRLALRLVSDSVEESFGKVGVRRDEARAWLRTEDCPLSARMCFEALDFEYAAVMEKLERRWREADGA